MMTEDVETINGKPVLWSIKLICENRDSTNLNMLPELPLVCTNITRHLYRGNYYYNPH